MSTAVLWCGIVVAVAAAVRSTWSPCGLSMLSTITPFGERARGHRYWVTATWFVVGAVVGGATLGGFAAVLALGWSAVAAPGAVVAALAGVAALVCSGVDADVFGPVIPLWRRQVDDAWLARYRSWVYASGFGWQIGAGVVTYIMTAGVFLVVVLAALTGSWSRAWLLCCGFGLVRGLAVLATSRAATPAELRRLHQWFDRLDQPVRWTVVGVQALTGIVALGVEWPVAGAAVGASAVAIGGLLSSRRVRLGRRVAESGRVSASGLGVLGLVVIAALATGLLAASCGSTHRTVTGSPPTSPATVAPVTTVVATGHLPTVPNCGGGAYEPKTLLIVCGSGSSATMATEVSWKSWGVSAASGNGTVHLDVSGAQKSALASLKLTNVATGPVGPQYTSLTVTWTGMSPDGHPSDTYKLSFG